VSPGERADEATEEPAGARALAAIAALGVLLAGGIVAAWLVRDAPLEPERARGLLRADALSALLMVAAAGHGLVALALRSGRPWQTVAQATLVSLAALAGHLAAVAVLLLGVTALQGPRPAQQKARERAVAWLPALCSGAGLALCGLVGGEWRYGAAGAGAGLNSASFGLLLLGALLGFGAAALPQRMAPRVEPFVALGGAYGLLRLFSLGPWNLGWLFAALLAGGGVALWAAWSAASAPPAGSAPWLWLYLGGLVVAGAGLGSGAGLTLAGYALLLGPVLRLGLEAAAARAPSDERGAWWARPGRAALMLSAAAPLGAPFVAAWMAVAAATAGGVTVLALALWAAALLAALPAARLALAGAGSAPADAADQAGASGGHQASDSPRRLQVAAALSGALGIGAPLVVTWLLRPLVAQLQGGLTPFGEIELWPWAGLIAYDSARQPVATLPSLALIGLMLILSALCWVALRLGARRAP
jgi:hypothetical protein